MSGWVPYRDLPPGRRWHAKTGETLEHFIEIAQPVRFMFDTSARIASAGSCFGGRIAERMRIRSNRYLVMETAPPGIDRAAQIAYGYWPFSARYGFVYTSLQLLQLAQRAFGVFEPHEIVWERDGRYVDPFRPRIEPNGFSSIEELQLDRAMHLQAVRRMFTSLDVFVFTLGLTEVCVDYVDGAAFPLPPGIAGGSFDPGRYGFKNLTVSDNKSYLGSFLDLLAEHNPNAKVILTVSPTPIAATLTDRHVVRASTYSKSVLRVACEEISFVQDRVDYFSSYEMVADRWAESEPFTAGSRHVRPEVAELIAEAFLQCYFPGVETSRPSDDAARPEAGESVALCDEDAILAVATAPPGPETADR